MGLRTSAVRTAIDDIAAAGERPPISQKQIDALGEVCLWRILLEPYLPKQKGLLVAPDSVRNAERIISKVGRIVQVGEFCYQSKTTAGLDLGKARAAQVGEFYLFEMYAGQEVQLATGHFLRILTETELLMRVNDPESIRGYL